MKLMIALSASAVLLASAAHAGDAGVEATVRQFGDAFDKGDVNAARALHVTAPSIIDEFGPHYWSGPRAFDSWLSDLGKSEAAEGKTGGRVAISSPTREVVSGDRAYVVVPSTYTFKQKGVTLRETAQMTFVLAKETSGWKIVAWTWTGAEGVPVK
ncbi:MAG TPA: nuclear transport factor 2 family protein [Caulobacteraceae bacterium]